MFTSRFLPAQPARTRRGGIAALATVATVATCAAALSFGLASPAVAATGEPDAGQQALLEAYFGADSATAGKLEVPDSQPSSVKTVVVTAGKRIIHKRGTSQLWTSNTLEWYWNSSKITSSTGWQAVGYTFPNTAKTKGISRTLKSNATHIWRGTVSVGVGTPTPWGTVEFYETSVTDNYELNRDGSFTVD